MTITAERAEVAVPVQRARRDWARVALPVLLVGTGLLYLVDLGASGWANAYYSAAAQAGAQSWKALLFGATDSAGGITVDKAPAAVWLMSLSARVFGVNAWSVLVPQALLGVGSVWLLHDAVRRTGGRVAGLVAGVVFAVTPVAALIFRFNNPDALLVLLLVAAAWATVRALERASAWWLVLAGAFVGFGFLAKMLQAFLVLPAFGLVYLVAAPTSVGRRVAHLGAAAGAVLVSAGWWVALVQLWPAADRPYVGGSQTNSVLELVFGYNGFGRITGDEVGSVGGSPGGGWGATGWARLFGGEMAGGIAWLLPAALLALGAGLWLTRRAARTDPTRAGLLLWGGWLLVTAAVFSYMNGIIHPYYTVALAPAIGALVGIGAVTCWRRRDHPAVLGLLAGSVALTALVGYQLLGADSDWQPWLRPVVLIGGLVAAAVLALANQLPGVAARAVAGAALVVALLAPGGYTLATAATPHSGAIPSAGPSASRFGGGQGGQGGQGGPGGGMGGLLDAATPGATLTSLLRGGSSGYTWAAATVGSNNAAGYQLAAGVPVLAVGGFNGTDPYPTLAGFQAMVAQGKIHYFLGAAMMQGGTGSDDAARIAAWVAAHHRQSTVDGVAVYDLTAAGT